MENWELAEWELKLWIYRAGGEIEIRNVEKWWKMKAEVSETRQR